MRLVRLPEKEYAKLLGLLDVLLDSDTWLGRKFREQGSPPTEIWLLRNVRRILRNTERESNA